MTKKAVWLSYDLGLKGDYPALFTWLDNHEALECGSGVAFFRYNISRIKGEINSDTIFDFILKDLTESVKFSKTDRVYIIFKDPSTNKVKGEFLNGDRKQSPWEGYGKLKKAKTIDTDE